MKDKLRYWWYRWLWRIAPYRKNPSPIHLDLELTNRCPLKCKICYHSLKPLPFKLGDMSLDMAIDILKQAKALGFKSVKLNWRGEPLISPIFSDVIKFAHSLDFVDIMVNTCLAGATKENLIACAMYATDLKISHDEYHYDYTKHASATLHEDDFGNRLDTLLHYRPEELKPPIIQMRSLDTFNERSLLWHGLKRTYSPIMKRGKEGIGVDVTNLKRRFCGQPSRRVVVGWDGKCYACCVAYNNSDNYLQIGYLPDGLDTLESITQDGFKFRERIIRRLKRGEYYSICKTCTSKEAYKL